MHIKRAISVLFLGFLVLLSGSSFVVGIHRCQGEVKELAIGKTDGCEKQTKLPPCHRVMANPCCEDDTVLHEGQGFKFSQSQPDVNIPPAVITEHPESFIASVINTQAEQCYVRDYHPPLRTCDRNISLQVFLI